MFPIPWNKEYRKKDGTLVNIDDAMSGGGGGSELPEYSAADAGKVLGVTDEGTLAWVTVSSGVNSFSNARNNSSSLNITTNGEEITT